MQQIKPLNALKTTAERQPTRRDDPPDHPLDRPRQLSQLPVTYGSYISKQEWVHLPCCNAQGPAGCMNPRKLAEARDQTTQEAWAITRQSVHLRYSGAHTITHNATSISWNPMLGHLKFHRSHTKHRYALGHSEANVAPRLSPKSQHTEHTQTQQSTHTRLRSYEAPTKHSRQAL